MESVKEAPQTPEAPAAKAPPIDHVEKQEPAKDESSPKVPRFNLGALVPINGVWFKIARIEKEGLFLEAVAYTGKGLKK